MGFILVLSSGRGGLVQFDNAASVVFLPILLIMIGGYVSIFILLRHRYSSLFKVVNIIVFLIFLLSTPTIQIIQAKMEHNLAIPSQEIQKHVFSEIDQIIEEIRIPYKIDINTSENDTEEYGQRVYVVLVRTNNGDIQKEEINKLLDKLPDIGALSLSFHNHNNDYVIGLNLDKEKRITQCTPYDICKEFDFKKIN
ncbi:hypothetical protein [Paenibacillus anaericanus]|uniref:hypothetical protein n=1 Tax=Paenibacillus anaericanus TaxID=170367 RepID=UPI000FC9954B|nr:hypothetical protein [Paenibacillus anaericanus]